MSKLPEKIFTQNNFWEARKEACGLFHQMFFEMSGNFTSEIDLNSSLNFTLFVDVLFTFSRFTKSYVPFSRQGSLLCLPRL